ncbi:MAG: 16S rRNA (cytosine(1402)-N(4))-methyltransferase RsmH [Candidatus Cyclobacteriaceae bacterium M3_2C_046]
MTDEFHEPVLLKESVDGLLIKPQGVYVDLTFGGGGHAGEILKRLTNGHLFAFDQDQEARLNAEKINHRSFTFISANFRYVKQYLKSHKVTQVDGILGDFGVSSHQIDQARRGFSSRYEGQLDMRMNSNDKLTAAKVVNEYDEKSLHKILGMYGEVKNARTLALAIVSARAKQKIITTTDLTRILDPFAPKGRLAKYLAQVFQAIRIEVNQELKAIEDMLLQASQLIKPGGRLSLISYHSLEDRMVKNFMLKGNLTGKEEKDFFGNLIRPFQPVNRKPIVASEAEIARNKRARSAKLRIAEKLIAND